MGNWALVKDGVVQNTIVWEGPGISPMEFDKFVEAIEIEDSVSVSSGYLHKDGVFEAPPLTEEQQEAIDEASKATNVSLKLSLMNEASQRISVLQDATDLEMATDEEKSELTAWKKYRILLSRVDADISGNIDWPANP